MKTNEEPTQSSQPVDYAFTTALASSSAAQQLSDETGGSLEANDRAKPDSREGVAQQMTLAVNAAQVAELSIGNLEADDKSKLESGLDAMQQSSLQLNAPQMAEISNTCLEAGDRSKSAGLDAQQPTIGPVDATQSAEVFDGSIEADYGVKSASEQVAEEQSQWPAEATHMSGISSDSLQADDKSDSDFVADATQQSTLPLNGIKAHLNPRQGATSSPHSPFPKDATSRSGSPLPKDATVAPNSPFTKDAISGPHSPFPRDAATGLHTPLAKSDASQQKAGTKQRLRTPPRREKLQGSWSTVSVHHTLACVTHAHLLIVACVELKGEGLVFSDQRSCS